MKRFRNFILVLLSIISCGCFTIGLSACSNGNNAENTQDKDILAIYNMYVVYAEENNTTPLSYSDWLLTIKGEKGEQGEKGEKGEKGDKGEQGEQGLAGINGTNGTNGKDGINGINGIDGKDGVDGINGKDGADGQDGKSAYEIWLDNGYTGSETDFLNWLKGSDGKDGQNGKDGVNGTNGIDGKDGVNGINGTNGVDGKDGLGIKNVAINDDGDLIITFDDDSTLNAGNVVNKSNTLNENNKITFNTLEVTENNVYGKVSNETATFSFIKEINLIGNASYTVYTDLQGTNAIPTKTVYLEIGDNTFYVLETCGNDSNLYTVTIRRRPIYTVSFVTTGENSIPDQQVEEDSLAVMPTSSKSGYYWYCKYNEKYFDFSTQITENITLNADEKCMFILTELSDNNVSIQLALTLYVTHLEEIIVPSVIDGKTVIRLKRYAFGCSNATNIVLPETLEYIDDYAFNDSLKNITVITLPKSLKSFSTYAFYNYPSKLEKIVYNGTMEEWNLIEKGTGWEKYTYAKSIVCTDGAIELEK